MAVTNKTKLAEAEKQIGRYQKKVGNLQKENEKLRKEAEHYRAVFLGAAEAVKAPLIAAAMKYGETPVDPDTGEVIPRMWRIEIPNFDGKNLAKEYEMRSRYDAERDMIVIAVGLRDDPQDEKKKAEGDNGTFIK